MATSGEGTNEVGCCQGVVLTPGRGVRAWTILPAPGDQRHRGMAAEHRLGVGLGGDRRVRQPLPRTRVRQQPRPVARAAGHADQHFYDRTRASTWIDRGPGIGDC